MKAYVFPGQGTQFTGMGKDLCENSTLAKVIWESKRNEVSYHEYMFERNSRRIKETKLLCSIFTVILAKTLGWFQTRNGRRTLFRRISFSSQWNFVIWRRIKISFNEHLLCKSMQIKPSTMAAV
jgi:[acyl-carrier-protein] S-malonyltransferase